MDTSSLLTTTTGIPLSTLELYTTFLSTYSIVILAVIVLEIVAKWRMFTKAGEEGWKSIIPIYNLVVEFKIAGLSPWLILLCLLAVIPFIGSVVIVVLAICERVKLGKAFGKSTGFILGMIFLSTIFDLILGFDSSEYQGTKAVKEEE